MPRIRHIAIATRDPEGTARFYKEGLGLKEAETIDSDLAQERVLRAGASHRPMPGAATKGPGGRHNVEVKFLGSDGVTIDLSGTGWVGLA